MRQPTKQEIIAAIDVLESAGMVISLGFWTTGAFARTARRRAVSCHSFFACSWCLNGAISAAHRCFASPWSVIDLVRRAVDGRVVETGHVKSALFNDTQTSPEPVAQLLFDAADDLRKQLSNG